MGFIKISSLIFILIFTLFAPIAVLLGSADAETGYISDMLIVGLRKGQGQEYKIIRNLKTDTPVEVLEKEGHYFRVRTEDGEEGWVLRQYISFNAPKAVVIAELKEDVAGLEARLKEFEEERASLRAELDAAKQRHAVKVKELGKSAGEYKQDISRKTMELRQITEKHNAFLNRSKDVVKLIKENDKLKKENNRLNTETDHLQKENSRLMYTGNLWWFLSGSGVFLAGWIVGKLSRKRKYY
ncbi:MAG: TIGR04211 family SH3 domain-containing protein [Desulfobacterales bacterium]|nr:TIGR04211 family SH3 domain-containing protein [Desulfobacterales bacterium]